MPALLLDYLGPSLDTTISAVGSAIWLFGCYPEQWDQVRANPSLIPNAFRRGSAPGVSDSELQSSCHERLRRGGNLHSSGSVCRCPVRFC